jgi:type III secretory pathway component EscU
VVLLLFGLSASLITGSIQVPLHLLFMGLLYAWFNLFQENITAYIRTIDKPMQFLWLSIMRDIIEIGLVVLLVIYQGKGATGRVLSGLITAGVVFIYAVYYFIRKGLIHTRISKKYLLEELKFGSSQIFFNSMCSY